MRFRTQRGLPTWDKPAMACLSSRIPYGTPVTIEALDRIEAAEAFLRSLGLRQLRVRHHGDVARIEVEASDMAGLVEHRDAIVERLKALGYTYVTLDLARLPLRHHERSADADRSRAVDDTTTPGGHTGRPYGGQQRCVAT